MTIQEMMDQFEIQGTVQVLRVLDRATQTIYCGDINYADSEVKDLCVSYMYADADPLDEPSICFEVE